MKKEQASLDGYMNRVYKLIMIIISGSCMIAGVAITALHYLGYARDCNETFLWLFNLMDLGFVGIGVYYIKTGFDRGGMVKSEKLKQGKYAAALIAVIQWNAITYLCPFRDFWAFLMFFIMGEALFFDIKLVRQTTIALVISIAISWVIKGDVLLPVQDGYFVANMTVRLIGILGMSVSMNVLTYFGGKFLVEELEKYAYRDSLTNLLTRKTMNGYLEIAYKMAQSYGKPFCLLMLDIDDFKAVNDTYGHECGDVVLKAVSGMVLSCIEEDDQAFRWGGEEILAIVHGSKEKATEMAELIRTRVSQQEFVFCSGEKAAVTVTIGVIAYDPKYDVEKLMEKVDKRLYEGKRSGKNQVVSH
ncbi:MAG: GGDEF domain-containing protein [Lachnospiraceae bacterium]|nr:GGDEF domain-containing protein [Lachnospiraceae bacterium]